tara:strand:- start:862 stop:1134 length:273 start_codon:yes stop_codon:yes gene_type:complete
MNGKKAKRIRNRSLEILVSWVKNLVSDPEKEKITKENAHNLLPTDTHIYANNQVRLSAFSLKWIVKRVKKFSKTKPINEVTLKDIIDEHY